MSTDPWEIVKLRALVEANAEVAERQRQRRIAHTCGALLTLVCLEIIAVELYAGATSGLFT